MSNKKTEMSAKCKERKHSTTGIKNAPFDMAALKESLALAEMKAAAASSKIIKNLDIKNQLRKLSNSSDHSYVPPKQLLLYLVRYDHQIHHALSFRVIYILFYNETLVIKPTHANHNWTRIFFRIIINCQVSDILYICSTHLCF